MRLGTNRNWQLMILEFDDYWKLYLELISQLLLDLIVFLLTFESGISPCFFVLSICRCMRTTKPSCVRVAAISGSIASAQGWQRMPSPCWSLRFMPSGFATGACPPKTFPLWSSSHSLLHYEIWITSSSCITTMT